MILHGLYHFIASKRQAAGVLARQARDPHTCPRIAYEKATEADRLTAEAENMADHAKGNEEMLENFNKMLHYLAVSKHQSRYRKLVITDLESAQNWLLRENGQPEPERNFQALNPEPPHNGQAVS